MSVEDNKRVVTELIERMAKGDSTSIDELTTDGFVSHYPWIEPIDYDKPAMKSTNYGGYVGISDY